MPVCIKALLCFLIIISLPGNAIAESVVPPFSLDYAKKCESKLRSVGTKFRVLKRINGAGNCGSPRPLEIRSFRGKVTLSNRLVLRCQTALALSLWVNRVVKPAARRYFKSKPRKLLVSSSYNCRRRNHRTSGPLSEHAYANAIDVMGIKLARKKVIDIKERKGRSRTTRFQAAIRKGACRYFTTVIGPGTNEAHSNHFHFDRAVRINRLRLCQ